MIHRFRRQLIPLLMAVWFGAGLPGMAASGGGFSDDLQRLLSRLQSMSHGLYAASQWNDVFDEIYALLEQAEASGDTDRIIDVTLIMANVHSEMLGNHTKAVEILTDIKTNMADSGSASMPKIYVRLAEVYSRTGDEGAILDLIEEFRTGPYYDPESYTVTGGEAPGEPFLVQRPSSHGDDSVSVSTMRRFLGAARFAPGRPMPAFEATDRNGVPVRLSDYRGRVLLVDFWLKDWVAWKRGVPQLVQLYERYQPHGFDVLGVSLDATSGDLDAFLDRNGITWRQVVGDRSMARACGVVGDAANFLVGPDGTILRRNLYGGELSAAVRAALGM